MILLDKTMSDSCCAVPVQKELNKELKIVLWVVFAINAIMFLVEMIFGYLYQSTALMADSLDMLSDAFVYGLSILVVLKDTKAKAKVSFVKGVIMTAMALYVVYELVVRVLNPVATDGQVISLVGIVALLANATCFWLLYKHKSGDINMRSAWVCSRNDVVANVGVVLAGVFVLYSGSNVPDLVIGALIAMLVLITSFKVIVDSVKELMSSKQFQQL